MSDILTIDWSERRVRGVVARNERDGVRVTGGFDEAWPDTAHPKDDVAVAGQWLGERIRACGFSGKEVRVCVPRSAVIVRRLDLPAVPVEELPPMVEMQTATRSASGLEGLALDFVPVASSGEGSSVLAATTARKLLDTIKGVCEATGLRVTWVGLGPLAAAELVVRATQRDAEESSLIVGVHDQTLETTLVRGKRVLFSQSSEIHGEADEQVGKAVSADIRRSLVAHGDGLSATALDHVWWLGDAHLTATQREIVSDRLGIPVEPFNPLANELVVSDDLDVDGAVVSGAIGTAFVGDETQLEQLDFLHPRKPPKKVDVKRQRMIVAGCIAATLLVGTLIWRQVRLSSLAGNISDLQSQKSEAKNYADGKRETTTQARAVREWESWRRDWLGDVAALEGVMPDRDRALMTELHFEAGPRAPFGSVRGKGRAKFREEVEQFENQLGTMGYKVIPHNYSTGGGAEYDVKFDLDATMPDPAKAAMKDEEAKS